MQKRGATTKTDTAAVGCGGWGGGGVVVGLGKGGRGLWWEGDEPNIVCVSALLFAEFLSQSPASVFFL